MAKISEPYRWSAYCKCLSIGFNSVNYRNSIVTQFQGPVYFLSDAVSGLFHTGMTCLQLERNRLFIESGKDVDCSQKTIPNLFDVYCSQLLKNRSYLTGDDQLKKSVRVYMAVVKSRRLKESLDSLGH